MNAKALIPLVAGLGIGGLALKMGLDTVRRAKAGPAPAADVQVWVPAADIPRGAEITAEMLKTIAFPVKLAPPGVFKEKDKDHLVGRVPRVDVPADLPVLESMLLAPGARAGMAGVVKPGFRAVSLRIDEGSGVDYHIEPGNTVDVVGSFMVRRGGRQEMLARTIVQNVEVAAVGARSSAVSDTDAAGKQANRAVRAVTIFVQPDDVPRLLLAEQRGRIKLSLRGEQDQSQSAIAPSVSDAELTGEKEPAGEGTARAGGEMLGWLKTLVSKAATAAPPAEKEPTPVTKPQPPWEVVVFRGDEREVVCFKNRGSRERAEQNQPQAANLFGSSTAGRAPTEPTPPEEQPDEELPPPESDDPEQAEE